jgi:hypothetical protein
VGGVRAALLQSHASPSEAATERQLQLSSRIFRNGDANLAGVSLRAASICILVLAIAPVLGAKEPRQIQESGGMFIGSVGCKSSSCHGGAGEKRSQYFTWSQKDYHTKAYAILLNARSERIAEGLGINVVGGNVPAAATSARCTVCHAPFQSVAANRLSPGAHPDEGVSCESCHGAAGGWLRGHTRKDWTYNTRVGAGLRDLRSLYVRATACAACHQNLEPQILKAGHPDLFFELDGQSVAEPKHWKEDDPWNGLREWLTGQATALREMSWALAGDPRNDEWSTARWNGLALCDDDFGGRDFFSHHSTAERADSLRFHEHADPGRCFGPARRRFELERE